MVNCIKRAALVGDVLRRLITTQPCLMVNSTTQGHQSSSPPDGVSNPLLDSGSKSEMRVPVRELSSRRAQNAWLIRRALKIWNPVQREADLKMKAGTSRGSSRTRPLWMRSDRIRFSAEEEALGRNDERYQSTAILEASRERSSKMADAMLGPLVRVY